MYRIYTMSTYVPWRRPYELAYGDGEVIRPTQNPGHEPVAHPMGCPWKLRDAVVQRHTTAEGEAIGGNGDIATLLREQDHDMDDAINGIDGIREAMKSSDPLRTLSSVHVGGDGVKVLVDMCKHVRCDDGDDTTNTVDDVPQSRARVRGGKKVQTARLRAAMRELGFKIPDDRKKKAKCRAG